MNKAFVSYRTVEGMPSPSSVSQYLAANNWLLERRDSVREFWRLPGNRGDLARIMLPLAPEFADFDNRFSDVLETLSRVHGIDPAQLVDQIAADRADLFFVRLDQPTSDGSIPFRQAEASIEALYKLLRAAATTTHDPNHSHQGRRSSTVTEFLDRDIRLGQTMRGSFVFTIVSRLGPPIKAADPLAAAGLVAFPRSVMETLAHGLETTRDLTRSLDESKIDSAARFGLSASLVESLEDLAAPDYLQALDLSFRWAESEGMPSVGAGAVVLDRAAIDQLPRVRERLARREEPPRRETLIGPVRSLTRENSDPGEPEAATIVLVADVRGRARAVSITVTGDAHHWAIIAYQRKLPFTVTGDLVREGRGWRLGGDISVDTEFLEHHSRPRF